MALVKRRSISTFVIKYLWILFLVFQKSNLVICGDLDGDSLKNALEAIERRQRDLKLQDNEYYGQPENIGYGFHKTLGFFDNSGSATELGSFDSDPKNDNDLQSIYLNYGGDFDNGFEKRKSNFRERMSSPRNNYLIKEKDNSDEYPQSGMEYLQLLKNLWSKYRQSRPDDFNIEDLSDEQVEEILNSLYDKEINEDRFGNDFGNSESNGFEMIPIRNRKNYRVFERIGDAKKRYPSFGEGIYGKRNLHSQNINYQSPSENDFLYSLKYVNPEFNREAVENLRDEGFEMLGDEKDKDIIRLLNSAMNRPKYIEEEEEPYWLRNQNNNYDEDDVWFQGPVTFSDDGYEALGRNEKRTELTPRFFKNHNGIHFNSKRFPVTKRSAIRVRKDVKNEKVAKELKGIFATTETTTIPPKKTSTKKPTEGIKKQNATKPEVTKHHESKKVVRRADKYTKEQIMPVNKNEEIAEIFNVKKKSIDWSQYFGIDKRSSWLKNDYLQRAESHFMPAKNKRLSLDKGNVNFLDRSQYEMPFDTRNFNKKSYSYDIRNNIDKVENKIGDIEDKIIDDAVKYTGAHSGGGNEDLNKVKSKVIQHLEAAYSLEKMKNALEEFKNLIKPEKSVAGQESLKKTVTEAPKSEVRPTVSKEILSLEEPTSSKKPDTSKRVAVKKEGVNIFSQEPLDSLDFLNNNYAIRQREDESCPVLDKIMRSCIRIEEMVGRYAEVLTPLCSRHQICYFCGNEIGFSKLSMCDAMYLSEARSLCQGDSSCLFNARNSMVTLQDMYEQDLMSENGRRLLSDFCLANPCIQRYLLNSPGAIYPIEIKK